MCDEEREAVGAGVVDEHVDGPSSPATWATAASTDATSSRPARPRARRPRPRPRAPGQLHVADRDARSLGRQAPRRRGADAARPAGDERRPSLESHARATIYSAAAWPRVLVSIIGATGDLGFGLAVRWAHAGVAVTIGSRDAGRAPRPPSACCEVVPAGERRGAGERGSRIAAQTLVMSVPFAGQAPTYKSIAEQLRARPARDRRDRPARDGDRRQADARPRRARRVRRSAGRRARARGRRPRQRAAHRQRLEARPSSRTRSTSTCSSAATARTRRPRRSS